jgi:peptidoglycan hydrolase-like protein with peptidoglycan-binding domain
VIVGTNVSPTISGFTVDKRIFPATVDRASAQTAQYAKGQGSSFAHVALTSASDYADAFAAAPYLAKDKGILLLTGATSIAASVSATISTHASEVAKVDLISLSSSVIWQVWALLPVSSKPPSMPTLTIGSRGAAVVWLERKLAALTYRPGPVDGVFDQKTYQAVIAFEKWEGLSRNGKVTSEVWTRLVGADRPTARKTSTGTWVEVDKVRQVLLLVRSGVVIKTLPVSTGSPTVGIVTPSGDFAVYLRQPGWPYGVGHMYYPCFFMRDRRAGPVAIHGLGTVPTYPASHGCVRVTLWDMPELYPQLPVGPKIFIY